MKVNILQAASQLREASENHKPCKPVREIIGADIGAAYTVQLVNTRHLIANGYKVVGKKIGLTSIAVQTQLGVDQPDFGVLFDFMQIRSGGNLPYSELLQPKAEVEIAFVLKDDLLGESTTDDITRAIDYAVVAIEIAGSRVENWDIRITDTIADNASASHFVVSDRKVALRDVDLEGCSMALKRNGEVVSEGFGNACLGNPLNAVKWLANTMARLDQPLKAGEIILSGALGPMSPMSKGDVFLASISGMGEVGFTCS